MLRESIKIKSDSGLHAREASAFVKRSSKFRSDIFIEKEDFKINAKSIIGVMAMGLSNGDDVVITADGIDEEKAMEEIKKLLENL